MIKRRQIRLLAGLLLMFASSVFARTWSVDNVSMSPFGTGPYPSMALINGHQPVVSNYYTVLQKTAFGWVNYQGMTGFIDGDGGTKVVSNDMAPVKYGKDGRFYSTAGSYPYYPGESWAARLENGVWMYAGVSFFYTGGYYAVSSADALGRVYVTDVIDPSPLHYATDLAISDFGDIAIPGWGSSYTLDVWWYDYVLGWRNRSFGTVPGPSRKVAAEFDKKGNLGVAYVDGSNGLHFAYLDIGQDYWTDEVITTVTGPYYGAALKFNYQDLPVIVAGNVLAYDPIPEPTAILLAGLLMPSLMWRRRCI